MSSARQVLSLLLGRYLGREGLGGVVGICLTLKNTAQPSSVWTPILTSHVF